MRFARPLLLDFVKFVLYMFVNSFFGVLRLPLCPYQARTSMPFGEFVAGVAVRCSGFVALWLRFVFGGFAAELLQCSAVAL